MCTSDTVDYFENLADSRKDERPVDLLLRKYTEHGHDVMTVDHAHAHHRTLQSKTQINLQN